MAPIPAFINVNFIANYAGDHRICWRIGNSGPYDCTLIVKCLGGGNPCSGQIIISVDNETCDQVDFNGYVQPVCQDEGSLDGRIPFQVFFTPTPVCKAYDILCESSSILSIDVINQGTEYLVPPLVTILGGGIGATATAVINGSGNVTNIIVDTPGSGYTVGSATIGPPGMGGEQATISVNLAPCPEQLLGDSCGDGNPPVSINLEVGQAIIQCMITEPVPEPGYVFGFSDNCCYNCNQITFNVGDWAEEESVTLYYTDCTTKAQEVIIASPNTSHGPFCAIEGTAWWSSQDKPVVIVTNPTCPII